jgi:hypothetical protein
LRLIVKIAELLPPIHQPPNKAKDYKYPYSYNIVKRSTDISVCGSGQHDIKQYKRKTPLHEREGATENWGRIKRKRKHRQQGRMTISSRHTVIEIWCNTEEGLITLDHHTNGVCANKNKTINSETLAHVQDIHG